MRNILLIIFIVGIYGCKKCADCTRVYTTHVKEIYTQGDSTREYIEYNPNIIADEQEVCGSSEIKDFEQQTIKMSYDTMGTLIVERKKIGTCTCITK
jgi:hypothetical protein